MSLRPIEMQGSIPRSQNVGKIQEQMQQRSQMSHGNIVSEHKKEEEQKRKQVNNSDPSDFKKLEPDKEKNHEQQQQQKKKDDNQETKDLGAEHPYKGKFIDFSG